MGGTPSLVLSTRQGKGKEAQRRPEEASSSCNIIKQNPPDGRDLNSNLHPGGFAGERIEMKAGFKEPRNAEDTNRKLALDEPHTCVNLRGWSRDEWG